MIRFPELCRLQFIMSRKSADVEFASFELRHDLLGVGVAESQCWP